MFDSREEAEHRGTWGKDASKGERLGLETPPWCPPCPLPEAINVGSLPELDLLFDPRGVHFKTPHHQVLLEHWAQLGWVKQWRQGKAVVFGMDWGTHLALPRPIYNPGCQPSYEGLIP